MWQNKPTYAPVEVICEKPGEYKVVPPLAGIDFKQWMELLLLGFLILYPLFWLILVIRHRDGSKAYITGSDRQT